MPVHYFLVKNVQLTHYLQHEAFAQVLEKQERLLLAYLADMAKHAGKHRIYAFGRSIKAYTASNNFGYRWGIA